MIAIIEPNKYFAKLSLQHTKKAEEKKKFRIEKQKELQKIQDEIEEDLTFRQR